MANFVGVPSSRPGWEDVVPVPQSDGPNPVVAISYLNEFRELMDLFRAVLVSGEKSHRVLDLTEEILEMNAANYTVWEYRRQTLESIGTDLNGELDFMDSFAEENPKNYQIWYHRRVVVERLGDPSRELEFTAAVFEVDGKNYHAWSHRQWALATYGLWEGELTFIEHLLQVDIRNNSAWNQRWFVVHHTSNDNLGEYSEIKESTVLIREYEYVLTSIQQVKCNESSWNYLRGLWRKYKNMIVTYAGEKKPFHELVESKLCQLRHHWNEEIDVEECQCIFLYEMLTDIFEDGDKKHSSKNVVVELFSILKRIDPIRSSFWQKRLDSFIAQQDL